MAHIPETRAAGGPPAKRRPNHLLPTTGARDGLARMGDWEPDPEDLRSGSLMGDGRSWRQPRLDD